MITETKFLDVILWVFAEAANKLLPVKYIPQVAPKMKTLKSNPTQRLFGLNLKEKTLFFSRNLIWIIPSKKLRSHKKFIEFSHIINFKSIRFFPFKANKNSTFEKTLPRLNNVIIFYA